MPPQNHHAEESQKGRTGLQFLNKVPHHPPPSKRLPPGTLPTLLLLLTSISGVFHVISLSNSSVFHWVFQVCFTLMHWVLQICFALIHWVFQACFTLIHWVVQACFTLIHWVVFVSLTKHLNFFLPAWDLLHRVSSDQCQCYNIIRNKLH